MPIVLSCALDIETTELATLDNQLMGTYPVRFKVQTDGPLGPISLLNQATMAAPNPLPSSYATYSYLGDTDLDSYAQDFRVERDERSRKLYYITVTYRPLDDSDKDLNGDPVEAEPDPILRPPVVWWDREVFSEIVEQDKDGKPLVNPLGYTYDQTIELPQTRGVLVIEFNVLTLAEVIFASRQFETAINNIPWSILGTVVPARTAVCREVSTGPPLTENGITFFHLVFRFAFAREGGEWTVDITERGQVYWKKDTSGEYILLSNGERDLFGSGPGEKSLGDPVGLLADGTRADVLTEDAAVKNWHLRREVDFNTLPF